MSKHRSSSDSPRLQKVVRVLEAAGRKGITTFELQMAARVTDVKDILYELRCNGVEVRSEWVGPEGGACSARRFKCHWLAKYLEPQRALPLDLEPLMEAAS